MFGNISRIPCSITFLGIKVRLAGLWVPRSFFLPLLQTERILFFQYSWISSNCLDLLKTWFWITKASLYQNTTVPIPVSGWLGLCFYKYGLMKINMEIMNRTLVYYNITKKTNTNNTLASICLWYAEWHCNQNRRRTWDTQTWIFCQNEIMTGVRAVGRSCWFPIQWHMNMARTHKCYKPMPTKPYLFNHNRSQSSSKSSKILLPPTLLHYQQDENFMFI